MVKAEKELQGKKVEVTIKGGHKHQGVVLGMDEAFKDIYLVGITSSTVSGSKDRPRSKEGYISIFYAKRRHLRVK